MEKQAPERMVTIVTIRKIVQSFPETTEAPYFEKTSFRVKKKIFATFESANNRACVKLSEIDQDVFSSSPGNAIFPMDNKWGKQGWTLIDMGIVHPDFFLDAVTTAYCEVAPKKRSDQIRKANN